MDDKVKEQLSALVDGELPEAECRLLLARLERDSELRLLWERYQLAGEVLRNQAARYYDPGFSQRVMQAVGNEPAGDRGATASMRNVSLPGWLRTGASVALAASVAVVAVLLLQPGAPEGSSRAVGPVASAGQAATPDFRREPRERLVAGGGTPSAEVIENLGQYVVNHNEFAARAGLPHLARQVSAVELGRVEMK